MLTSPVKPLSAAPVWVVEAAAATEMKRPIKPRFLHRTSSRLGPLLMLFQRSPVVQWLFPEAKILGTAGLGEITRWTVATVAGLGAYDSVSGATSEITQIFPQPGSTTVDTAIGAEFGFGYQITGNMNTAKSWSVDGALPPGLIHGNATNSNADSISGIPTEEGEYPIIVTAWELDNNNGKFHSQPFAIIVGPPVITTHPASITIASGTNTTLSVSADAAGGTLIYQWFRNTRADLISGATSATFTTPNLSANTSYLVRVIRGTITTFSNPATVTIGTPDPFQQWRSAQFNATQLGDANISGPAADPDGDSFNNTTEYVFGNLPLTKDPSPLALSTPGTDVSLSFTAKSATGTGYAGKTRHYAIETRTDLVSGTWTSPVGFSDIVGSNQVVTYTAPRASVPTFYRLRVWLTP